MTIRELASIFCILMILVIINMVAKYPEHLKARIDCVSGFQVACESIDKEYK